MKVLFVSSQALFRDTRFGGAKRLYYLAKELESRCDLHVICLDGCDEIPEGRDMPREFERLLFLPRERNVPLFRRAPFLPEVPLVLEKHRRAIADFLGDTRFDATVLAFSGALHFLDRNLLASPGKTVYLEDDLYLEQLRSLQPLRYLQGKAFYKRALKKISAFICISPQEERVVKARWPRIPTRILGYGIPLGDYPLLSAPWKPVLGFIGNYRHLPNRDAAQWLVKTLFPALQVRIPDARLVLCGAAFPEDLREECLANGAIELGGDIGDLTTFYRAITVFINPLREGRGLRTKVIEAAAYGRPVVSTKLGAEGLEGFELGLFETTEDLAGCLRELSSPESYGRAVAHNRAEVERLYSMEEVGRQLLTILSPE